MKKTFKELLEKFRSGTITGDEVILLQEMIVKDEYSGQLSGAIDTDWYDTKNYADEETLGLIYNSIQLKKAEIENTTEAKVLRIKPWVRRLAAAVLIGVIAGGAWLLIDRSNNKTTVTPTSVAQEITAPHTNRATITLADGTNVFLDSAGNGQLAQQGNVKLVKLANGRIAYQHGNGALALKPEYNTLTNPRGSQVITMRLADGSHVWLNAGSSITYPVAFIGNERKVNISGEAYFEIAHDPTKPFFVTNGDVQVQVLGTHFNVNAYDNESEVKVTLLEGSVEVKSEKSKVKIVPGQQAVATLNPNPLNSQPTESKLSTLASIDLEAVMAWKNGKFFFNETSINDIMKEVARWYDVEVVYAAPVNERMNGELPRTSNLADLTRLLEATKLVRFEINNKTVTVYPK